MFDKLGTNLDGRSWFLRVTRSCKRVSIAATVDREISSVVKCPHEATIYSHLFIAILRPLSMPRTAVYSAVSYVGLHQSQYGRQGRAPLRTNGSKAELLHFSKCETTGWAS